MKIGIMTYHRASNYGAVLQAYALSRYLNDQGHKCEIVDYRSRYLEKSYGAFPMLSGKSVKNSISQIINTPVRIARKKTFDRFRSQYMPLSKYYDEDSIHTSCKEYDTYIFGSDQVWNNSLNGNDINYFGAFEQDSKKLNAYAASFGDSRPSLIREMKIDKHLARYNYVGIRESKGVELFKSITNHSALEVVDPVFLLPRSIWESFIHQENSARARPNGYIFVYHLKGKKTCVQQCALEISKKEKLKIIDGQGLLKKYPSGITVKYNLNPLEFLDYIFNADYVVTDSFHCTAFSVIFQKKFWSVIEKNQEPNMNRVGNLLVKIGLENRLLSNMPHDFNYREPVCFEQANPKLEEMRVVSKNFLLETLK